MRCKNNIISKACLFKILFTIKINRAGMAPAQKPAPLPKIYPGSCSAIPKTFIHILEYNLPDWFIFVP